MGKGPNKATRKLIKKGRLDHTSRVAGSFKKKAGLGRPGKGKLDGGKRPGVKPGGAPHQKRGGKAGHNQHLKRSNSAPEGANKEAEDEEAQAVGGGIEDMDVDAFMNGGMFGIDVDGDGSGDGGDLEADEEEEEEEEEGEDDDDESLQADRQVNGKEQADESSSEEDSDAEDDLRDEMRRHKAELEKLKATDPDFFKFLEKNDGNLLNFGEGEDEEDEEESGDGDEAEDMEEDEEEGDDDEEEEQQQSGQQETQELTTALLQSLEHAAIEQHSVKALRKLVLAFKAASHMADEQSRSKALGPYSIVSSTVFDRLLVVCLSHLPDVFGHHILGTSDFSADDPTAFTKMPTSATFRPLKPIVYRCLKALHYLLNQITEPSLLTFILSSLKRFVPFLIPFQRQAKLYLKTLLQLWASSDSIEVKLDAFMRIRQLAITQPFPFMENCLKGLYLAYVRNSKFMTESSMAGLTFMGNCVVELYGLDMTSSYQHAFVYLRQLALHLRAACTKKTKDAIQRVQSWQFMNCLRVWASILTAYPGPDQLQDLIFPLIQITLGVAKLGPSARYYPMLFHCVNLIQRLASRAKVFVPCASMLLDVLENPGLVKKPKATTEATPNLHMAIRLGKDLLDPKVVQDAVVAEALDLLNQEVLLYRYTIAFPEYAFPIRERLRRFQKNVKPSRWKALAKGLAEDLEKKSSYVSQERTKRELAPTDNHAFEALLPKGETEAFERVKAVMDAKFSKLIAASSSATAIATSQKQQQREERQNKKASQEEEEDEVVTDKKQKKKAAVSKKAAIPEGAVDEMEDEVGDLDAWSDQSEGEEEEEEEEEDVDDDDGDEDGQEEDDDEDDDDDDDEEDEEDSET